MSETLTANLAERIDNKTLQHVREEVAHASHDAIPESTATLPQGRLARFLEENVAKRLGRRQLSKLLANRGRIAATWGEIPDRMHQVAKQTKLMMELMDDFRTGAYRNAPWRSLAVCTGAILYVASPADVVPEIVAGFGVLDDIAVAALAARMIRNDLRQYCEWKGYPVREYFAA
jgi:uncharacterized membrane protein YkvA (DUF1232 family)